MTCVIRLKFNLISGQISEVYFLNFVHLDNSLLTNGMIIKLDKRFSRVIGGLLSLVNFQVT